MAYKVSYTPRAFRDLDRIFDYIAEHNPAAASKVKSRIRQRIDSLATFPAFGRETETEGLRMLPVGRYPFIIFYEIDDAAKQVAIVHIRHAARDR